MSEKGWWCYWRGRWKKLILLRTKLVLGPEEWPFRVRCGIGNKRAKSNVVVPLERRKEEAHPEKGEAGPGPPKNTVSLNARCG